MILIPAIFSVVLFAPDQTQTTSNIRLTDVRAAAGIDFEHYGERHRWCEIGPEVQGIATNEEIPIGLFEDPFEFANRHHIEPIIDTFPMHKVNKALEHLHNGKARYRIVLYNEK